MLLWNYCLRFRYVTGGGPDGNGSGSSTSNGGGGGVSGAGGAGAGAGAGVDADGGVSEEVAEALAEAAAIDDSLDMHKCNLDTLLIYETREYTHK